MGQRLILIIGLSLSAGFTASAHDIITTPITWDREISRIVYERCASCHHEGGRAFSLMTYAAARPWAVAIKEEVLERRMPPWGAVKGFGDFRNDQGLTPEQLELIISWVGGGVPEGEAKDLAPDPKFDQPRRNSLARNHRSQRRVSIAQRFLAGRSAAQERAGRRGVSDHRRAARRQHRAAIVVRTLQREVRSSVFVSESDRTAGRHQDSRRSAGVHGVAAAR